MSFVRDLAISGIPLAHEAEELLGPGSPGHSLQEVLQGQRQVLLRLVTVGPVGPVAEVVRGSHLLAQRLRRGQEEHGESQREPHRRLDVRLQRGGGRCSPSALTGRRSAPHFIYLETGRAEAASFA